MNDDDIPVIDCVRGIYMFRTFDIPDDQPLFVAPIPILPTDEIYLEFSYGKCELVKIEREGEVIWKRQERAGWMTFLA